MDRKPIQSSNIKSIGYDPKEQALEVEFHSGAVHQYAGVSAKKHAELMKAKSIGGYFHVHIRNFHKATQV